MRDATSVTYGLRDKEVEEYLVKYRFRKKDGKSPFSTHSKVVEATNDDEAIKKSQVLVEEEFRQEQAQWWYKSYEILQVLKRRVVINITQIYP